MKYVSRYVVETPAAISGYLEKAKDAVDALLLDIGNGRKAICSEWLGELRGVVVHKGLIIDVYFEAESEYEKLTTGFTLASTSVLMATFASGCAIPDPHRLYTFSITDGNERIIDLEGVIPLNSDTYPYSRLVKINSTLYELLESSLQEKVDLLLFVSCMRWYRSGLETRDIQQRFIFWWTALMTLESTIRKKYIGEIEAEKNRYPDCVNCGKLIQVCDKCSKDIGLFQSAKGDLSAFSEFANLKLGWNGGMTKLQEFRSKLLKTGPLLTEEVDNLTRFEHLPKIRVLVLASLGDLLNIPQAILDNILLREDVEAFQEANCKIRYTAELKDGFNIDNVTTYPIPELLHIDVQEAAYLGDQLIVRSYPKILDRSLKKVISVSEPIIDSF